MPHPVGFDPGFDARWAASITAAHAANGNGALPPCPDCGHKEFYVLHMSGDRWTCRCRGLYTLHDATLPGAVIR